MEKYLTINSKKVSFNNEKSLLEVIRNENIELHTFCYHSELSVYGSCRLCLVEVEDRGIISACSVPPEPEMNIKTNTERIIKIRKIIIELLLANHNRECTICAKSESCKLQTLARRLGIKKIRFKNVLQKSSEDASTYALVREPSKCVLCGDCVRFCDEIQGIGALGFANRGPKSLVCVSFNRELNDSECVYCGQCARVCPTGAIMPKYEVNYVWKVLSDSKKKVIVAIAPAVRAAIGELFGLRKYNGDELAGKIVTSLKTLGFAKVFDISFAADMTIVEETNEFLKRIEVNDNIPMFTSCCPAWVRFVEQYYPDFISHLSTCRSPQGMYGSIVRRIMPRVFDIPDRDLVVVSVMPCTAKKYEARRHELAKNGINDIDCVLTTQELAMMIEEAGICFEKLESCAFDMPLGFKTGGGVIFGNSGGVTEAILRNIMNTKFKNLNEVEQFSFVRGERGLRKFKISIGDKELKIAIVYGLNNARKILKSIKAGSKYDFVEVMACPGGCVGGAGQPICTDLIVRKKRTETLYENDKVMNLHKSSDNPYVQKLYKNYIGKPGNLKAHEYLHTNYSYKKRFKEILKISDSLQDDNIKIDVCFGNNCISRESREILSHIVNFVENGKYKDRVNITSHICLERCFNGPNIKVNGKIIERCSLKMVEDAIRDEFDRLKDEC
ncbi:MAG: [FeFe] hydrogenase, group A [Endomicrobium sp.]|jgi:NADH-quinone oxidoreductase subunit G|nr:[FeFe] hydrogenase, group A [Endomicrobium sp.]